VRTGHRAGDGAQAWRVGGAGRGACTEVAANCAAVDVTCPNAVVAAARSPADDFGRIDALVTSAGIAGPNAPVVDCPAADRRRSIEVKLQEVFRCCRALVPSMMAQGYGYTVNIT